MYSGYLYMAMSASCTSLGLKGFANWFMVQYHEEMAHTIGQVMQAHFARRGISSKASILLHSKRHARHSAATICARCSVRAPQLV
jgi:ferritin